ncbi:nephrin-like [Palaemon carinicauda]|uniref:nephrin-like n=1 Tax=Palaemon carinicauda TaxID=392227 RepID=UPI0035B581DA
MRDPVGPHWRRMKTILFLGLVSLVTVEVSSISTDSSNFEIGPDGDDLEEVRVVLGYNASLPCSVPSPDHDVPALTLWYIEERETPVYSYDERPGYRGMQWADQEVFGSRAYYAAHSTPPVLVLSYVTTRDARLYRCRVDFLNTNSRVSWVNLTVIVPPSRSEIMSLVSPVHLGDRNDVTCKAYGGNPSPQVLWLQDGRVVDATSTISGVETYNVLEVEVTRNDLYSPFVCRVTNNDLTGPPDVQYLRNVTSVPLIVRITGDEEPTAEGRPSLITCTVIGSNPPPLVTWYQQGQLIKPLHAMVTERDNVTKSVLTLNATRADHGRQLMCRAYNKLIPEVVKEDIFTLDVTYKPIVNMTLGRTLNASHLREGSDLFFECHVNSNPKPYKVQWYLNGEVLIHNVSAGILVSETTLALQKVKRERSGDYVCSASNVQGDTTSQPFHIDIKYAPRCTVTPALIGVGLFESLNVSCLVDADPPDVSFTWTFNNSIRREHNKIISPDSYSSEALKSVLYYSPRSERDYGTLLCHATNSIGTQSTPCSFTVISAGPPEEVSDCIVENITTHSCSISCTAGFNGGLPQSFLLQIWLLMPQKRHEIIVNYSSSSPNFFVQTLSPGKEYEALVIAFNSRGAAMPVTLPIHTNQEVEIQQSLPSRSQPSALMFVLGVIGGAMLVVALLLMAGIMWMVRGKRRRRRNTNSQEEETETSKIHKKESNPDIIDVVAPTSSAYSDVNISVIKQPQRNYEMEPSQPLRTLGRECYRGGDVIAATGGGGGGGTGGVGGGGGGGGGGGRAASPGGGGLFEGVEIAEREEEDEETSAAATLMSVHRRISEKTQGGGAPFSYTEPLHLPIQRSLQESMMGGPYDDLHLLQKSLRGLSSLHHPL